MNKIRQVCWFLTRECDLRCSYCKVWQKRQKRQLNTTESKKLLDIVKTLNPEILIFFGGEPTLRPDFNELVQYANKLNINYAIITNGRTKLDYSICKNITCSVDIPPNFHIDPNYIDLKSHRGYKTLIEAKEAGVPDVVANMIIHKHSYKHIPSLIEHFSNLGIWSIVGYVHSGKENFWEFRNYCPDLLLNQKEINWISKKLLELKDNPNILLHNVREYFEHLPKHYNFTWHCSKIGYPSYLTIDEDGSIMTCPDFRGKRTSEHNIFNLDLEKLKKDWKEDIKSCPGCYYNHMIQLAYSKRSDNVLVHKQKKLKSIC